MRTTTETSTIVYMHLDVATLFWVLNLAYVANLLFALILYLARYRFPGAGLWIAAELWVALGTSLLALRTEQTPYFLIVLSNTFLFTSTVFYAHAVSTFRRPGMFPVPVYLLILLFAAIFFGLENTTFNLRVAIFSAFLGGGSLIIFGILCYRPVKAYQFASWITGIPFLLIAMGSLARIPESIFATSTHTFSAQGALGGFVYLFAILTASVSLFGYYLLSGVRFEATITKQASTLRSQNEFLLQANRNSDLFMSVLAHDLRAPISGASRYVNKFLLDSEVDLNKKRAEIRILAVSLEKTNTFLENMLWWTRSQREDWHLELIEFPIEQALFEARDLMRPETESKEILLVLHTEPVTVYADLQSVELILRNLLSNALKFTPPGKTIQMTSQMDGNEVLIRVIDEGMGIEPEVLQGLYNIADKVTTKGTFGESGSGMGLILCKIFAERNGGTLEIKSTPGTGTIASLRLPITGLQRKG